MFTGIIEETGTIKQIKKQQNSLRLTISAKEVLKQTKIGDSIATNGVCLTVTDLTKTTFSVDVMYETLNRTNIHSLTTGDFLNLERALTLNSRLGGHMVSGHIDGLGTIQSIKKDGIARLISIHTDKDILKYIIKKGSVAIDGISLTVVDVTDSFFIISIIPHTIQETNLSQKRVSDKVNIECDLIGKYVEKLITTDNPKSSLTKELLKNYGY
ncbi:MAG: riboflavin synthase [Candidatus Izimaplasma sp.]|nr:riboflavin synthase [Candidatus Izimaplasma bacterium]